MVNSYTVIKKTNIKGMTNILQYNVIFYSIASCTESLLFAKAQNQIKTVCKSY